MKEYKIEDWKDELEIINKHENTDFIICLYILKYQQIDDIEFRKNMIDEIINCEQLLLNSQRFFFELFYVNRDRIIEMETEDQKKSKNNKLTEILNDEKNEKVIMEYLDKKVDFTNDDQIETKKKLSQILLYIFSSKILFSKELTHYKNSFSESYKIITGEETNITYPNLTRIFACAFYQKYLLSFCKSLKDETKQYNDIIPLLEENKKHNICWKYSLLLIGKILYSISDNNIENYKNLYQSKLKEIYDDECNYYKDKSSLEIYDISDNQNYLFYPLIFEPSISDTEKINQDFSDKSEEYSKKYPILSFFIQKKNEKTNNILKYLPIINDFENTLLDYFNFQKKIDRNYARNYSIEKIFNVETIEEKFNEFKKFCDANQKLKIKDKKYNTQTIDSTLILIPEKEFEIKKINKTTKLDVFFMDYKEGISESQIKKIYEILTNFQNGMIYEIKEILENHKKTLEERKNEIKVNIEINEIDNLLKELNEDNLIKTQEANINEIMNIDNFNLGKFDDLNSLITIFSKRKCFENGKNITIDNYNKFEIDYENIENHLRKCFLYGKKLFSKQFNYIEYQSELSELSNFNKLVNKYGYQKFSNEKNINLEFEDINKVQESFEKLINYINKNTYTKDKSVSDIISDSMNNSINDKEFINFITTNNFKLNELSGLYDYIEEQYFEKNKNQLEYEINNKNKDYEHYLETGKILSNNEFITKDVLLRALRIFMNHYLIKKEKTVEPTESLFKFIVEDQTLWLYQNKNEEAIEKRKNDSTKIEQFFTDKKEILVKDTRLFYDILNGDYDKKIKFSNQKNIMKNKKNEEEEEEEEEEEKEKNENEEEEKGEEEEEDEDEDKPKMM